MIRATDFRISGRTIHAKLMGTPLEKMNVVMGPKYWLFGGLVPRKVTIMGPGADGWVTASYSYRSTPQRFKHAVRQMLGFWEESR